MDENVDTTYITFDYRSENMSDLLHIAYNVVSRKTFLRLLQQSCWDNNDNNISDDKDDEMIW